MIKNFEELIKQAKEGPPLKLTVAAAENKTVLESVRHAVELGIVEPILIGDEDKIKAEAKRINYKPQQIIATNSKNESAHRAIELIAQGEADFPMKGLISSKVMLRALLNKKYDMCQNRLFSTVTLINLAKKGRIVAITDPGINIAPDLDDKVELINNAVELFQALGVAESKVAALAAVEAVNPAMPATIEAAALAKMADRGQIPGAIVDGPLALDNAICREAAEEKGITSPVAGAADILLAANIEAGNVLYKSLITYSNLEAASLVIGGKVPLVFTSRADSSRTKFYSIVLGKLFTLAKLNKEI
ncbi:bifunctional enoyl-CoA hydratase/phosphate acetyltransferase [Natroniella sulfidigena]|uniref:bifunctional enoyl-CoA hydratase/phosphate acetyltransferase n=1 Tax=Natroniella sulfidigena TaxID=723921 RepID=UPI00200B068B|nr:bifunctional enoyl-CoA hydratase/phosphate acetyltransferase [Natroniella sulfidigena]MCK8817283.1 bifunctional enoyl-CoA hydratase/phosphate acetyltransferase [Natroniella sulfidigena]